MGASTVEREGVSFTHPARFTLVGTMNPEEGDLRPQLLDRFGLCVQVAGLRKAQDRVEIMVRRAAFDENPEGLQPPVAGGGPKDHRPDQGGGRSAGPGGGGTRPC